MNTGVYEISPYKKTTDLDDTIEPLAFTLCMDMTEYETLLYEKIIPWPLYDNLEDGNIFHESIEKKQKWINAYIYHVRMNLVVYIHRRYIQRGYCRKQIDQYIEIAKEELDKLFPTIINNLKGLLY